MVGSDENNPGVIRPRNNQVDSLRGGAVMGQNRRALRDINRNIIGVHPNPGAANKIGLSEKHGICKKSQPISGHRPVTRRFAAILANKQQSIPEEIKKPTLSAPCPSQPQDCTIADVEDHESNSDVPAPMVVHNTKVMLEGNDQMDKEVEMEDIVEEPVDDIDDADKKNQLAVVEYIEDIYAYYKKVESSGCVSPNYMNQQFDINERMRGILIDWLIEVHYKFELMDETLFLTVNLIDRFLAVQSVVRKKLQLVGVTAMLLACKYEEVSVPVVEDLILIADKAYTRKEVLEMEKVMLNTLQFNMSVPTSYVFMRRFLKAAQSDKKLELLSFFIIELCLVEYEMLKFPPSLLAASAIFTAQSTLNGSKQWNRTCEWHTSYSQKLLLGCSRLMVTFHQKSGTGKLTGVHRKYSTSKFGYAARSEPALFLLEEESN